MVESRHIMAMCLSVLISCVLGLSTRAQQSGWNADGGRITQLNVSIFLINNLQFGDFYPGGLGGDVVVSEQGMRTANGSVILLPTGQMSMPGVIEVKAPANTMMQINLSDNLWLQSSGGGKMKLNTGPLSTAKVFVSPPNSPQGFTVSFGGSLRVKSLHHNPVGAYSGLIYITAIAQ